MTVFPIMLCIVFLLVAAGLTYNRYKFKNQPPRKIEEPTSVNVDKFNREISKLKMGLVDVFLKEATMKPPLISDEQKKDVIQYLLGLIPKIATEAIRNHKEHLYLFSTNLPYTILAASTALEAKSLFAAVVKDVVAILKTQGIHTEFSEKFDNAYVKIMVKDLKKFSNYEKLGALK